MNKNLQTIWEQLNAVLYDLEHGNPADAIESVEDCIARLETLGADNEVYETEHAFYQQHNRL